MNKANTSISGHWCRQADLAFDDEEEAEAVEAWLDMVPRILPGARGHTQTLKHFARQADAAKAHPARCAGK